jgi:hypothetical protein
MNRSTIQLLFLFSFFLFSCGGEKPLADYGKNFAEIMKTSEGMFRGIEPGRSKKEILEKEKPAKPKDEDDNYLYYEFPHDTGELYTIEYNFDERGLEEVRLDAYYIDAAEAHTLFLSCRDYYTGKYGETEKFEGFAAWAFKDPAGRTIQLELNDESAEYRQGKFSLVLHYMPGDPAPVPPKN